MEAFWTLIAEENAALDGPLPSKYKLYEAISHWWLPHVKHQPFFDIVLARGNAALLARREFLHPGYFQLLEGQKVLAEGVERRGLERLSEIERRYNVAIPPEVFNKYLVGFAERMLKHVKKNFPEFDLENADLASLIEKGVNAKYALTKALQPDVKLEDVTEHLIEEDTMLSFFSVLHHVRAFYQDRTLTFRPSA